MGDGAAQTPDLSQTWEQHSVLAPQSLPFERQLSGWGGGGVEPTGASRGWVGGDGGLGLGGDEEAVGEGGWGLGFEGLDDWGGRGGKVAGAQNPWVL